MKNGLIMRKFKPIAVVILLLVVVAVGLIGYGPISFRMLFIKLTSSSKWDEYRRLSQLLHIGMDTNKVADILGQPDLPIMGQSNLQCWVYAETGPGASWSFIAQFEKSNPAGHFQLCYCVNINDEPFAPPVWNELGQRQKMAEPVETAVFGLLRKPGQKRTGNQ
jgi:hypothetical protein